MTALDRFRASVDHIADVVAEFRDVDVDAGTFIHDQLRRVRGTVLRLRSVSPRLCFLIVGGNASDSDDNDDDDSSICIVLKSRHGWVDDAVIERIENDCAAGNRIQIDVVGLIECGDGEVGLHAIAFRLGEEWLHTPLRADLRPVVFQERISSAEQRRLNARENGERVRSSACNRNRAAKLVRFVVARCGGAGGLRRIAGGAPILDIAGGNGSVSIEFVRRRVSAHVVDPRQTSLTKNVRDSMRFLAQVQLHDWQSQLATKLVADAENRFRELNSTGIATGPGGLEIRAHNVPFNAQFCVDFASLWNQCRLVVALHPDQPTEDIVDFCLAARKSFFVVPCCVFPKAAHNSHRRHVTTTSAFCEFLRNKAPDVIHIDELVMEGRNQVVWAIFD